MPAPDSEIYTEETTTVERPPDARLSHVATGAEVARKVQPQAHRGQPHRQKRGSFTHRCG